VNFDASGSTSPGATITGYSWSFGGSGAITSHTFNTAGTYTVVLTVTDSRNQTGTSNATITVNGSGPTATPPPTCPTIDFTWVDRHNNGNPHRMDLNAALTPATSGYNYAWTGAFTPVGRDDRASITVNFTSGGSQSVAVTATLGACTVTVTKSVPVP
jgi:PKD repeat protein